MKTCSVSFFRRFNSTAVVAAVVCGLAGCTSETRETENSPTVVQVETVTLTEYAPTVRLTGDVRAEVESDLSFRVSGRIIERAVDVGDHVSADQVLARLDPEQQQETVTAAKASVQAAQAVLREITSTYGRQKALLAKGFTTKRHHDAAEEAYRTAQASLDAAEAELGTARDQLSYTVLRAGVSGVITARNAETGQVVQVAQRVFSIAQDGPRDAVFHVPESVFTREPGDPSIELTLVSDPAVKAKGTVREVSPTVEESSGTVTVKVRIEKSTAAMTLGASVVGEGQFQPRKFAVIPWSAVASEGGRPAVWKVDPQTHTLSLKSITVEAYQTGKVVVREGLRPGDLIVTAGAQLLRPQQRVAFSEGAAL